MNYDTVALKRLAKYLAVAVSIPLLIYIGFKLYNTGRIKVTIPDGQVHTVSIINQATGETVTDNDSVSGSLTKLLPSGKYEVRTKYRNRSESMYFVTVPKLLKTTDITSSSPNQADRDKVGRGGESCPAYSGNTLYTFNCFGSNMPSFQIPLSASGPANHETLASLGDHKRIGAESYQDGLLVLYQLVDEHSHGDESDAEFEIAYVKGVNVVAKISVPADFIKSHSGDSVGLSVSHDNTQFVVYTLSGKAFLLFDSIESEPKLLLVDISRVPKEASARSFKIEDNQLFALFGTNLVSDIEESYKQSTRVMVFDFASGELKSEIEIPTSFDTASPCANGKLCLLSGLGVLSVYNMNSEKPEVSINSVRSFTVTPKGVAYLKDDTIYLLSDDLASSRALFTSTRYKPSKLYTHKDKVLFNAFYQRNKPSVPHTFLLGLEPSESNIFMDDYLPYSISGQVTDMDYVGSSIFTTLLLDSASANINTGVITYNQAEFQQASAAVIQKLQNDGFTSPEYNIGFIISN